MDLNIKKIDGRWEVALSDYYGNDLHFGLVDSDGEFNPAIFLKILICVKKIAKENDINFYINGKRERNKNE